MESVQQYLEDILKRKLTESELRVLKVAYYSGRQHVFEKWVESLK
jgi:hypothetical protein